MSDAAWAKALQNILNRERCSLLQFVREAYPWTNSVDQEAAVRVQQLTEEEQQAEVKLANFLARHGLPQPTQVNFPLSYTSLNFVSLDYLLPHLIEQQRQSTTQLKVDLAAISVPEARQQVEHLLELKERDLKILEDLAAESAKAAAHA